MILDFGQEMKFCLSILYVCSTDLQYLRGTNKICILIPED